MPEARLTPSSDRYLDAGLIEDEADHALDALLTPAEDELAHRALGLVLDEFPRLLADVREFLSGDLDTAVGISGHRRLHPLLRLIERALNERLDNFLGLLFEVQLADAPHSES